MSYLDGVDYEDDTQFTLEQLGALTDTMVMRWFNFRTFGTPNPPIGHNMNPDVRSSTILYWKKAISFFMPNKLVAWNQLTNSGNPTRSIALNALVKYVKKKEVRNEGAPSKARRSLTMDEFLRVIEILKEEGQNVVWKYGIPAMMAFQLQMLARIDCTTQTERQNLKQHDRFDFLLKTKLRWSKNVMEERDAPWQTVLASMNHRFCVYLQVSLWLEVYAETSPTAPLTPYLFAFSNDVSIPNGGYKAKAEVQSIYSGAIFSREEFVNSGGPVGSHSTRKMGSSMCRNKGASKDEKDIRGRWKSSQRVSDAYDDIELPYPDAKVAALLCPGGPCKYVVREEANVTNDWILQFVVPHLRTTVDDEVAKILGRALLWYAFTPEGQADIPENIFNRIRHAYVGVANDLEEGANPVKKVPLVVTGGEGEVYIDEIPEEFGDGNAGGNGAVGNGGGFIDRPIRGQLLAVHSQLLAIRRQLDEVRGHQREQDAQIRRQYQTLNANLRRLAIVPGQRQLQAANAGNQAAAQPGNANGADAPAGPIAAGIVATLSPNPRDLYILWAEFQNGIGGRKAARLFTSAERGRVKHRYTRRKVVWETIARLVRGGMQADVAIDRIYQVYGRENCVTLIINAMLAHRRANAIPAVLQ